MRIKKEETIAVIIDVQERIYNVMYGHEQLTVNIQKLINGIQALGVEILVTEQYSKGLGHTIAPIRDILNGYRHIEKMAFSCCGSDEFMNSLKSTGKKNVIIAGIESHVCVLQTVLDLIENGFQPVLVEDCVSSRKPGDKNTALERMRQEGAIITTYESLLFELLVVSGTETFKAISKIVK